MSDHYEIVNIDGHRVEIRQHNTGLQFQVISAICFCGEGVVRKTRDEATRALHDLHVLTQKDAETSSTIYDEVILLTHIDPENGTEQAIDLMTTEKVADFLVTVEKIRKADQFKTYKITEVEV